MTATVSVEDCRSLLRNLMLDHERQNERSALVLLSLLGLRPDDAWSDATAVPLRTVEIMAWIREYYGVDYRPNTRETIRRQTLHQFIQAHLVIENPDDPTRPVNSPNWCYQVTDEALAVIQSRGTAAFVENLDQYLDAKPGLATTYRQERQLAEIPVTLPSGTNISLSAGGQNPLLKSMIEEFCPRFTPGGSVLYVGDAGAKWLIHEDKKLSALGVSVNAHGKMPDLVVHMEDRNWIVLLEAASTHGPVDHTRHLELKELFLDCTAGLVFVSCFPDQETIKKYLTSISWETEVWTADHPTHLVHFNGDRFLGPR
ncbi:MAG: restriction endonuclease [Acidimicrobiia bacterium]|nr:restriction endonuclease [Acidimicrobiia bacterium]MCY4456609.1 BsuBI/PstI family type II restriction endonuclease [Acidimicrobiaceae bacterium]